MKFSPPWVRSQSIEPWKKFDNEQEEKSEKVEEN